MPNNVISFVKSTIKLCLIIFLLNISLIISCYGVTGDVTFFYDKDRYEKNIPLPLSWLPNINLVQTTEFDITGNLKRSTNALVFAFTCFLVAWLLSSKLIKNFVINLTNKKALKSPDK